MRPQQTRQRVVQAHLERPEAVAQFADCEEISASTIPPDFERNGRIHRAWRLTVG